MGYSKNKFGVFDIESRNWIHPYSLVYTLDGINTKIFLGNTCVSDFLKDLFHPRNRGLRMYAHAGGKFDFNFIAEWLRFHDYDFKMIFQGSTCLMMKVYYNKEGKLTDRKDRHTISFSDSYAILRFSLDKLTKSFNVKHKKTNFMDNQKEKRDYEILYQLYKNNDPRFNEYVVNDVLGLYEVLLKFNNLITDNKGKMGVTIATTSLKTFNKSYLKTNLGMATKEANIEMKNGYYGGRVEIFNLYVDNGKYYCFDINSLYPYVMFENMFPISAPLTLFNPRIIDIKERMGITQCKIECPKNIEIPLLPYRLINKNIYKLVFPTGKFEGYYDNCLLVKAIELGYKITPIKMLYFNDYDYIFKQYVKNFYRLKQKSKKDTPPYIIAKLLLNSLYGKFAQNQESSYICKILNPDDLKKLDVVDIFDPENNMYRVRCESKGKFFIPQISIHVTALSQLQLYKYLEYIREKNGELFYCDTDSIFTNIKIPCSDRLGDLKEEYKFIRGYFLLPKTYCIIKDNGECYIKAKGYSSGLRFKNIDNKKVDRLSEQSFKNALFKKDYSGFEIISKEPKFNSMKTSFVRHKNFVSVDYPKKSIKSFYDKRIVLNDFSTRPLSIKSGGNI